MSDVLDETLMACCDGELDAAERRRVESYLRETPGAEARLRAFASTGRELARLFDQPMREPIPERLLDTAFASPMPASLATARPRSARQGRMWAWLATLLAPPTLATSAAFAGVLAVGGALGWGLHATQRPQSTALVEVAQGELLAAQYLRRVLETTPSGTTVPLDRATGQNKIKPVLTFASVDGGYCRQYDLEMASGSHIAGVACRLSTGPWRVDLQTQAKPASGAGVGIVPAGGGSAAVIESVVDRKIKGDALGAADELKLIANGWR